MVSATPISASSALALAGLSVSLGPVSAVRDLSLSVGRGEFVTLLGPSGCGKTTTLRTVAGYAAATAGRIFLDGADITDWPPQRRAIGMVFQNYALFPHMTVAENVAFSLRQRRMDRRAVGKRVQEMLTLVRLSGLDDRYPRQLSGGQQQRVAVARALAFQPRLLLLDEPLSALDRHLREEMQAELKRIQRDLHVTTLFVTHDQKEALALSDRIAVLREGRLEQFGTPSEVYERPQSRFVANFVGRLRLLDGYTIHHGGDVALASIEGLNVRLRCYAPEPTLPRRIQIGIRPENLVVDGATRPGCDKARVLAVEYRGEHALVELELPTGLTLHGLDYSRQATLGTWVALKWQERGLVAFANPVPHGEPQHERRPDDITHLPTAIRQGERA